MSERPLFILAGNGPYLNRGCEAIVRGTVSILRQHYNNPRFICISHFNSREEFDRQRKNEIDESIMHLSSNRLNKHDAISTFYRPETWKYIYRTCINKEKIGYSIYNNIRPYLSEAKAVLSVGGDNYSLDYGKPSIFTALDYFILKEKKPMVIWGASIGPFSRMPEYEIYMGRHLREVTGILARESSTIRYLKKIGVTDNVYPVSDPAFIMEPKKPKGVEDEIPLNHESIGINLSPLMAKYTSNGDIQEWTIKAASIIDDLAKRTGMPIILIPHVTTPASDDYLFMRQAQTLCKNNDVFLIPPKYSAAETKWIISHMALFIGSRTHSTIASLSSGVPTLSLAYSVKAHGINQDIFGHTDYCLKPSALDLNSISCKIVEMIDENTRIRRGLESRLLDLKSAAFNAGTILKLLIDEKSAKL